MHKVDAKLAAWAKAYERLKEAQAKYKTPTTTRRESDDLREEISRLQLEAELALKELQAEFDAARSRTEPSAS
jgi:hypothetical protein